MGSFVSVRIMSTSVHQTLQNMSLVILFKVLVNMWPFIKCSPLFLCFKCASFNMMVFTCLNHWDVHKMCSLKVFSVCASLYFDKVCIIKKCASPTCWFSMHLWHGQQVCILNMLMQFYIIDKFNKCASPPRWYNMYHRDIHQICIPKMSTKCVFLRTIFAFFPTYRYQ